MCYACYNLSSSRWHVCCSNFCRLKSKSTQSLVCRSGRAMGRFSLGSGDSGRFARYPPANPVLELASSGRREVSTPEGQPVTGTKHRRDVGKSVPCDEPVKKACKFGVGSRCSLQSKDESQVGRASESDFGHIANDTQSGSLTAHAARS